MKQASLTAKEGTDPKGWVDRYGDLLYRYALLRVREPSVAEDLVQETFLAALSGRDRFEGRSKEQSWLVGILKHKIIDYFRREGKKVEIDDEKPPREFVEDPFDVAGKWKNGPAAWGNNPESAYQQKEFWEILQRCLSGLPERLADVFYLRELDGLSGKEVCKVFGISSTNLWVILHRARHGLRECMERNWFGRKAVKEA